jgi:hypothetical protein
MSAEAFIQDLRDNFLKSLSFEERMAFHIVREARLPLFIKHQAEIERRTGKKATTDEQKLALLNEALSHAKYNELKTDFTAIPKEVKVKRKIRGKK